MKIKGSAVQRGRPHHATVVAYLALFVALGGTTWAAATIGSNDIKRNAVKSKHIKDDNVKRKDIRDDAVGTAQVANDELTGVDLLESSLGSVPNADLLGGRAAGSFIANSTYRRESAVGPGTLLGADTYFIDQACDAGDRMLTGGPANINEASDLLESFPIGTSTWRARIQRNAVADNFSVVVLCADQ